MTLKEKIEQFFTDFEDQQNSYELFELGSSNVEDMKTHKWAPVRSNVTDLSWELVATNDGDAEYFYEVFFVYKFTDGTDTELVKVYGHYQSHVGTDYEGWKYVQPKTKEVIEYV